MLLFLALIALATYLLDPLGELREDGQEPLDF